MQGRVRSELQLQVLRFYRETLKFASSRAQPVRGQLQAYIRREFQAHRDIPRMRFHQIEYQLRKGRNQLTMMRNTSIDSISFL